MRTGAAQYPTADPHAVLLGLGRMDFSGALLVTSRLVRELEHAPAAAGRDLVETMAALLDLSAYRSQKQAYFLYRSAAGALATIAAANPDPRIAACALEHLERRLGHAHDGLHRAVAESLGGLPLTIEPLVFGPEETAAHAGDPPPAVVTRAWLAAQGIRPGASGRWIGRSLVLDAGPQGVLVAKFLRSDENRAALAREALWMVRLAAQRGAFEAPFAIPVPLGGAGEHLMRWRPEWPPARNAPPPDLHPERWALMFSVVEDYYRYPNSPVGPERLAPEQACETLERCACLLGQTLGWDLVHTAPIPLFHNRTQQHRRNDGGVYEWPRAGRLDQWLDSCRYPNLARSGLRDFEHFRMRADTAFSRYEWIGVHLISLFLVAGSYYRGAAPQHVGTDPAGKPIDARPLFDPVGLGAMIHAICTGYRRGFVGSDGDDALPFDLDRVVARMIEEMGVDRHMEEVLRIADQRAMSRGAFEAFLAARGLGVDEIAGLSRGANDIALQTGPHLGDFNRTISLPELIHITGAVAADCVARRFRRERGWGRTANLSVGGRKDQVVQDQSPERRAGAGAE